jgi:hypothetical protein
MAIGTSDRIGSEEDQRVFRGPYVSAIRSGRGDSAGVSTGRATFAELSRARLFRRPGVPSRTGRSGSILVACRSYASSPETAFEAKYARNFPPGPARASRRRTRLRAEVRSAILQFHEGKHPTSLSVRPAATGTSACCCVTSRGPASATRSAGDSIATSSTYCKRRRSPNPPLPHPLHDLHRAAPEGRSAVSQSMVKMWKLVKPRSTPIAEPTRTSLRKCIPRMMRDAAISRATTRREICNWG